MKAILWDIDGTLLNFLAAEKAAIHTCFTLFGLGTCTDEMLADYSQINRMYWLRLEKGEMTKPEILVGRFAEFFAKYGLDVSKASAFNEEYQLQLGNTICFEPHAMEVVTALKGKVKQYAVTNGTKKAQEKKLKNSKLDEILDDVFISEEVGVEKPMQGFFDVVWERIGTYPKEEMVIVGDSLTSDMQGGINAGITTCWYNPKGLPNTSGLTLDHEIQDLSQVMELFAGSK